MIRHAQEVSGSVAKTCRYYGVSRPTYYKRLRRYEDRASRGSGSGRRGRTCARTRRRPRVVGKIIYLRQSYHFGPHKIAMYLKRLKEWEHFNNFNRPHGGLGGQTPYERLRQKTTSSV